MMVRQAMALDPREEFAGVLKDAGLLVEGPPVMDGVLRRVPVLGGKAGGKDGAYVGHLDGHPSGFVQNFKTGFKGEMLCTWARDHSVIGTGIDMSQLFTEQAKL